MRSTSIAALATLAACASHARQPLPERAPTAVDVATAHDEPLPLVYTASGTVRGRTTAVVTSKTTGYVRSVRVRSGDRVVAGQPLVELEANDVRATVARTRAALDQSTEAKAEAENALEAARAAAKIAKSTFERTAKLYQDAAIPQQQYDEAEARWRGAVAQERMAEARVRTVASSIDAAKAAVGEAKATLGYADIVAPFAGRVLERRVDPGALASPGSPLLVLADEGTLRVEAAVEESHADEVHIGDDADIDVDALPQPLHGKVSEIVPSVEVASRALLVKIDLPADTPPLHSGTFARVGFHVGARPRLVVPTSAISTFGALDRVFVVDGARARLRIITRGEQEGPWTCVLSGLSRDEKIVAAPPPDLRDGASVEARP